MHVVYRGGLCGEIKVDLRGSNGETASVNDDASMPATLACKTCTGGAPQVPENETRGILSDISDATQNLEVWLRRQNRKSDVASFRYCRDYRCADGFINMRRLLREEMLRQEGQSPSVDLEECPAPISQTDPLALFFCATVRHGVDAETLQAQSYGSNVPGLS